jgi:hypothetical protein
MKRHTLQAIVMMFWFGETVGQAKFKIAFENNTPANNLPLHDEGVNLIKEITEALRRTPSAWRDKIYFSAGLISGTG